MISIICACNNNELFDKMVKSSLLEQSYTDYEIIKLDAKSLGFSSAAQTLNHGASISKGDILLFMHQDVYLTDKDALKKISEYCSELDFAVGGVAGIIADGQKLVANVIQGTDKQNAGDVFDSPTEVDSVDECLFFCKKSEFDGFADLGSTWHFYSTELCLRRKLENKKVMAFPITVYHLSPGWSYDESYMITLGKVAKMYKGRAAVIPSTIGIYKNDFLLKYKILYRRLKWKMKRSRRKENKEKDIKLFTVTHKQVDKIPSGRILLGVGSAEIPSVQFYDNTGDNISDKNKSYCELTALYWIWKNVSADYAGLEHYRRFFHAEGISGKPIGKDSISKLFDDYDVILPSKIEFDTTVYDHYAKFHYIKDFDLCIETLKNKYPDYTGAVERVVNGNSISAFNMFIMKKNLLDEYCEWLFDILFDVEKKIDTSEYDDYQKRIFGFLSERLFNIWIYKKQLKCYYLPVGNMGDRSLKKRINNKFKRMFH